MKESNHFNQLLDRYLRNDASPEEQDELMKLISEGVHDELIKEKIDTMLTDESEHDEMGKEQAQRILNHILFTQQEPGRVVPLTPARTWRWIAAATVIAATVAWWTVKENITKEQIAARQEEKLPPAVFSGKQFFHLPDGSTVLLNEGSELSYAASFGDKSREVTLTGEAYFDVQHDDSRPFKVHTGKVTTTVLGTAFNVKAYPKQEIQITVTRGKVKVGDDQRTYGTITPDQQIAVNTTTYDFVQSDIKEKSATAWKSKYMILDDVSMDVAAALIAEKYNAKVIFGNDDLKKCRITATFLNGEDLDQMLIVVSGVLNATYTLQPDGNIKIDGKGCK
jgi:transmembrane sensor